MPLMNRVPKSAKTPKIMVKRLASSRVPREPPRKLPRLVSPAELDCRPSIERAAEIAYENGPTSSHVGDEEDDDHVEERPREAYRGMENAPDPDVVVPGPGIVIPMAQ